MINIRSANTDDAVAMAYIMRSLSHFYLDEGVSEIPQWLIEGSSVSEFEQRLANDEFKSYVFITPGQALQSGEIEGFISIRLLPERIHLQSLFVSESKQRRHVASQLWEYVLQEHPAKHYTVRSSIYAVPVYRRFGFVEQGDIQTNEGIRYQSLSLYR